MTCFKVIKTFYLKIDSLFFYFKSRQALHDIFFNLLYKYADAPISKLTQPFSAALFQRMCQPSGQDQQNGKRKYFRLPP